MKKYLPYIAGLATITIVLGGFGTPAHAENWLGVPSFADLVASIMNFLIMGMGFVLSLAGALLNFSIGLTLNISDFVANSPAIFTTWKAIRDISGMVIIFFLLYAAVKMILGFDAKFGALIKNIVIAGVLINFSFFFASLGIDASNIVSVQIYNAIAPANSLSQTAATRPLYSSETGVSFSGIDGGLSDIFMNSLKIQTIHNDSITNTNQAAAGTNAPDPNDTSAPLKIFFAGIVAVMIELVAALSFAAAALAFVVRFVVLLLLLAFSPIWFALHILPKEGGLGEYASKWSSTYKGMLLFMPVYLMLMYLALNVLTSSAIFDPNVPAPKGYEGFLILGVNAVIVIVLINMPLVAAMSVAGKATSFINTKTLGAGNLWRKLGSQTGSRTAGRSAYSLNNSRLVKSISSSVPLVGAGINAGLSKVSTAGFGGGKKGGYEERLKAKGKAQEGLHKKLGYVDESKYDTTTEGGRASLAAVKTRAEDYKSRYRSNLPWKGIVGGMFGFAFDNRANRQTAISLQDEANLKDNKQRMADILDKNKNSLGIRLMADNAGRLTPNLTDTAGMDLDASGEKQLRELQNEYLGLAASVERGQGSKKKKERKENLAMIKEELKEDGGGEKPEKGGGEKPPAEKPTT